MMTTAIFDGRCVICQGTQRVVNALDWFKRVEFLDLHQHEAVSARYPWLDHDAAMGEIHVVDDQAHVYAGYFGTRRLLRDLPLGWPLWVILQVPGMDWVGQRVYKFIAKNRYTINRWMGVELEPCEDGICKIPQ
ncbi:MAG: thiol-disulfide oxidoreductase DCC family protein [Phototrophicaceae bacterium]|jgi:predicted DCC family thiol-disulfide oxidoreductase YuxK